MTRGVVAVEEERGAGRSAGEGGYGPTWAPSGHLQVGFCRVLTLVTESMTPDVSRYLRKVSFFSVEVMVVSPVSPTPACGS